MVFRMKLTHTPPARAKARPRQRLSEAFPVTAPITNPRLQWKRLFPGFSLTLIPTCPKCRASHRTPNTGLRLSEGTKAATTFLQSMC